MNKYEKARLLEREYLEKLRDDIFSAFKSYELNFEWDDDNAPSSVKVWWIEEGKKAQGEIHLIGYNPDVVSEMTDSDCNVFEKFTRDIIENYLKNNPNPIENTEVKESFIIVTLRKWFREDIALNIGIYYMIDFNK